MSMWKKTDSDEPIRDTRPMSLEPSISAPPSRQSPKESATIGPSIKIRGDISGDEDLIVQGTVEGTINLKQNNVIVGKDGKLKANVHARTIEIEGHVEGDLHGDEQVVVRKSGNIRGNVVAPRVTLEDGSRFKGSIDMETDSQALPHAEKVAGISAPKEPAKADADPASGAKWKKPDSKATG